ncbi:MAG: RNA 2',3'-cyclic phosphodiesterase [Gammaproteobacteria bacterium]|nr:RNA 2',3'-cyclic phosphodiesterase [Gammaproteobacteria bacterium]
MSGGERGRDGHEPAGRPASPEDPERPESAESAESAQDEAASRRRRVFFALWPDESTRGAISRASRKAVRLSGGRPTAKRNLHITVAFLGHVDPDALERAASVPPVETGPFELVLDRLGYFREARALWLGPSEMPPALAALEQSLWDGLEQAGFEREPRIYRPHLTLARRARGVDETVPPVHWNASALTLVESIALPRGVHYEPLQDWPL